MPWRVSWTLSWSGLLVGVDELRGTPLQAWSSLADVHLLRVVRDAGRILETLIGLVADDDILVAFLDAALDVRGEIIPRFAGTGAGCAVTP